MSSVTAFLFSVIVGPFIIKKLSILKVNQKIRKEYCPELYLLHQQKEGTPTMGGILILLAVILSVLLWADLTNKYILLALLCSIWLGGMGF